MSHRVSSEILRILRNDVDMTSIIYALEIPWRFDDMKLRFICPQCRGLDTSVHPKVNLGRCFGCNRNFNTIDLVMVCKNYPFRKALDWLMTLKKVLDTEDGELLLSRQARRNRLS